MGAFMKQLFVVFLACLFIFACDDDKKSNHETLNDSDCTDNDTVEPDEINSDTDTIYDDDISQPDENDSEPDEDFLDDSENDTDINIETDENLSDDDNNNDTDTEIPDETDDSDSIPEQGKVLCTGLMHCYNDSAEIICPMAGNEFYGQDAQYAGGGYCTQKSFVFKGLEQEKTVYDNNTFLEWQSNVSDVKYHHAGAVSYCDSLSYGGYDDWRLPSVKELLTIIDYSKNGIMIDENYFTDTPASYLWADKESLASANYFWSVNLPDGMVAANYYDSEYNVKCVRNSQNIPAQNFSEETTGADTIFTDSSTKFQWTMTFNGKTWKDAVSSCENLSYAGYNDWRLPNINELETIMNRDIYNPSSSFPSITGVMMWSSTTAAFANDKAFLVQISIGNSISYAKSSSAYYKCVR